MVQRLRRASALPIAATVSGASTTPSRVAASSWSAMRAARVSRPGTWPTKRPTSPTPAAASSSRPTGPRLRSIHSRTTGSAVRHMSSRGSSARPTPSTTTMVFCSSSSSGRVRISNRPVTSNSKVSSFAIEMSSAVRLWIGSPIARIACAKLSTEWWRGT